MYVYEDCHGLCISASVQYDSDVCVSVCLRVVLCRV